MGPHTTEQTLGTMAIAVTDAATATVNPALTITNGIMDARISEFRYRGLRCVGEPIPSRSIVPDRGADIYEALCKPSETEFLLHTPPMTPSSHFSDLEIR